MQRNPEPARSIHACPNATKNVYRRTSPIMLGLTPICKGQTSNDNKNGNRDSQQRTTHIRENKRLCTRYRNSADDRRMEPRTYPFRTRKDSTTYYPFGPLKPLERQYGTCDKEHVRQRAQNRKAIRYDERQISRRETKCAYGRKPVTS